MAGAIPLNASEGSRDQDLAFGLLLEPERWGEVEGFLRDTPQDRSNPLSLTLLLPESWEEQPDWISFDSAVSRASRAGVRLRVLARLGELSDSGAGLASLAEISRRSGRSVESLGISADLLAFSNRLSGDPDRLALAIKKMVSALRGSLPSATITLGEITPQVQPILSSLYDRELRAYVDGYSIQSPGASGEPDQQVVAFLAHNHPGARIWLQPRRLSRPIAAELVILLAAHKNVSAVEIPADNAPEMWAGLVKFREAIPPGMGSGYAASSTAVLGAEGPRADIGIINLLDKETLLMGMLLAPTAQGAKREPLTVVVPSGEVTEAWMYQLPSGPARPVEFAAEKGRPGSRITVPFESATLLFFRKSDPASPGSDVLDVTGTYRIPVEVIIARHQAAQEAQDILLENYMCPARVDYRFKLPGGTGSLDITFKNSFFYRKGAGASWVQEQLLVNGVAWKGKKIPELPIIEPEKVNTLPLALTLGRDYSYRYIKDETVGDRECFVVEFEPTPEAEGSLYIGKIWIEKGGYRKLRMTVRQTGLMEPMVSSEETDDFADFPDKRGNSFRLLSSVRGQQIFSMAGRNIMAEREITFSPPEVNSGAFNPALESADRGDKPVLQETEKGLKYTELQQDGTRTVKESDTHRKSLVGGIYYDPSLDTPLPLFGINYFDYDWRKKKAQVNAFITGVVNSATLSKVDLWPKVDGRLDTVLFAISTDDKYYEGGVEDEGQRVKILREIFSAGLGFRVSEFAKISAGVDLSYYNYGRTKHTGDGFVLPRDHFDGAVTFSADYARWGWAWDGDVAFHRRSRWEPWGSDPDVEASGTGKSYTTWNTAVSKSFYLPKFQKVAVSAGWLDGRDLDRFSSYSFRYLGRLKMAGFSGSGVRFDRGGLLHLLYEFNIANFIRFSLQIDRARVDPGGPPGLWQNHTGLGLSGSVAGPWGTYWTLDAGYAVQSDIGPVRHKSTVALVILKLW